MVTDNKNYPPPRHGISPEVWYTFCAISDPSNRHLFTKEAAYEAFKHLRVEGGTDAANELIDTAREMHKSGLVSKKELSRLILLSVTVPMSDEDIRKLLDRLLQEHPQGEQSVALEEVLTPEQLAGFYARRQSRISAGGVPLQVNSSEVMAAYRRERLERVQRGEFELDCDEDKT